MKRIGWGKPVTYTRLPRFFLARPTPTSRLKMKAPPSAGALLAGLRVPQRCWVGWGTTLTQEGLYVTRIRRRCDMLVEPYDGMTRMRSHPVQVFSLGRSVCALLSS
jgi:hypothetical protein